MITGIIKDSNVAYKRKVSVNPVPHHYEETGEKPYIKYTCPVCDTVGNKAQVLRGTSNCLLCGVSLNWDRKPEVGDTVIICRDIYPGFFKGDRCVIVEDHSEEYGELPYVLEHDGRRLKCKTDNFTILDEPENE